MDYYERSIDHLLAELARLDVLLQRELSLVQGAESPGGEEQSAAWSSRKGRLPHSSASRTFWANGGGTRSGWRLCSRD